MAMDNNHRYIETMDDWMRSVEKDIARLKRRPNPPDLSATLGPGITGQAIEVIDWNDDDYLTNGWFFSDPPAKHAPVDEQSFIGTAISKDDGGGFQLLYQFVEDPDVDTPELWIRTWIADDDETPGFSDWFQWGDWVGGGGGAAPNWEANDSHAITSQEVTNGTAIMDLSYEVHSESLQISMGGLVQPPGNYTLDAPSGQVTYPLSGFEPAGTPIKAHYEWIDPVTPPAAIPWSIVNTRTEGRYHSAGTPLTSFALPSGWDAADILVYMQLGGFGTDAVVGVSDSRLYEVGTATVWGRQCSMHVGYVGAGGAPISMNLLGGNNAYGQFAHGTAMILRTGTSRQLQFRIARSAEGAVVVTNSGGTIPTLSAGGSGALACAFNCGGLGGGYGINWGAVGGGFTEQYENGNYEVNSVATTTADPPGGRPYPTVTTGGDETCVMILGVQ